MRVQVQGFVEGPDGTAVWNLVREARYRGKGRSPLVDDFHLEEADTIWICNLKWASQIIARLFIKARTLKEAEEVIERWLAKEAYEDNMFPVFNDFEITPLEWDESNIHQWWHPVVKRYKFLIGYMNGFGGENSGLKSQADLVDGNEHVVVFEFRSCCVASALDHGKALAFHEGFSCSNTFTKLEVLTEGAWVQC